MSDLLEDAKDTIAVNNAVIAQADAWLRDYKNFKVSDTPPRGPEENSGHAHEAPHDSKEIA